MGLTAAAVIAGVGAVGAIGSGIVSSEAAGSAASAQEKGALSAQQLIAQLYGQAQSNEQPYLNLGSSAAGELGQLSGPGGYLTTPWNPTPQQLSQTPGYEFTLGQGLQSTQAGFAAQGLGSSGAAEKGAATYATGLANNTWQQQWQQQLAQRQQIYSTLYGETGVGANAANALTGAIPGIASGEANAVIGGANAQAAGIVGQANATTGAISGVSNSLLSGALLSGEFGGTGGSGSNGLYGLGGSNDWSGGNG